MSKHQRVQSINFSLLNSLNCFLGCKKMKMDVEFLQNDGIVVNFHMNSLIDVLIDFPIDSLEIDN